MDIDEVRELIRLMVENDLAELDITEGENKIRLKRGGSGEVVPVAMAAPVPVAAPPPAAAAEAEPAVAEPVEEYLEITSPMVGTYYSAPSPDEPAFVSVGDRVSADTVVCVVEAMKVMNEIKAEIAGEIVEVCVENAQPIEYGQVLFRVKPV